MTTKTIIVENYEKINEEWELIDRTPTTTDVDAERWQEWEKFDKSIGAIVNAEYNRAYMLSYETISPSRTEKTIYINKEVR